MRVRILLPQRVLADVEAVKVNAEGQDGAFCLKPRHVNFVTSLAPGIMSLTHADGRETFYAVDAGVLVKDGDAVTAAVRDGAGGPDGASLGELQAVIAERFATRDEKELEVRRTAVRLEAGFIRKLVELQHG